MDSIDITCQVCSPFFGIFDLTKRKKKDYVRAKETASLLNLPNARWFTEFYLREREWGDLESMAPTDRDRQMLVERRDRHRFYWRPRGGESLADVAARIDLLLTALRRDCTEKRVLIVAHGELLRVFRARIERMTNLKFAQLDASKDDQDKIHNCQVLHYSRIEPKTGKLERSLNFLRMVVPWQQTLVPSHWRTIVRPQQTNEELAEEVESLYRALKNDALQRTFNFQ